jgi:hypothetical protein
LTSLRERRVWSVARGRWYETLEHRPRTYCSYLRSRRPANTVVTSSTTIVLEGFQGSANSFAREAVLYSNPDASVASHIHTAAHIFEALRLERPIVLPVRSPVDAIASYLSRGYPSEVAAALRAYERLHRRVLPVLDDVVVAPFERITQRFGDVVDEVNVRFGTELVPFPHDDPVARAEVFARLEAYTRSVAGDRAAVLQATPTTDRGEAKGKVRDIIADPRFDGLRQRCEELYLAAIAHVLEPTDATLIADRAHELAA